MPDTESDQQLELECLRLVSDLTALASATLNTDLKAHCLRLARALTDQVKQGPSAINFTESPALFPQNHQRIH
jgi:hypothetical protein